MTDAQETREVIPSGRQPFRSFKHLVPIAKFLVQRRGHPLMPEDDMLDTYEWGFVDLNGIRCQLARRITAEDWAAINEHFVVPDTITYRNGQIRDNLHRIIMEGVDVMITVDGPVPIDEYLARQSGHS